MNLIISFFKKKSAIALVFLCFSLNVFSQDSKEVWDLLLQNKREVALQKVNSKKFVNSVETLLLKNIVKNENGIFTPDQTFIEDFKTYPEPSGSNSLVYKSKV